MIVEYNIQYANSYFSKSVTLTKSVSKKLNNDKLFLNIHNKTLRDIQ